MTITIDPTSTDLTAISSYIIGACRDHAAYERDIIGNFDVKMASYQEITPRFGKRRKLYRLGGSPYDGNNNGGTSWSYPGYLWPTNDYGDGGNPLSTNVTSPYDDLDRFVDEAMQIDADMIIPINVITGTPVEANGILDFLMTNNLLDRVAFFEMGNELYGDWQLGHNMFGCNAERYGNRAAEFIHAMINHVQENGYSKDILNFALMGAFNGSWGTQASALRIVDNGNSNYAVQYKIPGAYYSNYRYNWELSDGTVMIDAGISVMLQPNVAPKKVTIFFGDPSSTPIYEFVSWDESCETGNNYDHSPNADWNLADEGIRKITDSYLSNPNLVENGRPIFQYIAYHNYADAWRFYHLKDGKFVCNDVPKSLSVNDVFTHVMAVNSKFENMKLDDDAEITELAAAVEKLKHFGVKLVNTEYGSIGIVGNSAKYSDGQEYDLSKTMSEALFTADQILTGIKYGMSGATAFSLFHTNDGGDNIFFPIGDNTNPYPSFFAQKLIAENLGSFYMGGTAHNNMPTINPELCNENEIFDQIGYAPTRDADGTIRILVLNRGTTAVNVNFDVGGQSSDYTANIISYHGNQVLSAPAAIDDPAAITNLSSVSILPYSINVLVLKPNNTCVSCATYTITGTETWTSAPSAAIGKITVKPGAVLTIKSDVVLSFCPSGSLEILPGGKVDLRGTLTSCGQEWEGVRVRGELPYAWATQGEFYGVNSKIENARIAIGARAAYSLTKKFMGSGIVECRHMQFLNNAISFEMLGFYGLNDVKFYDCDFDITNNQNFQNHIVLRNNKGTSFRVCDFRNHQSAPNPECRGILANKANFSVDGFIWSVNQDDSYNIWRSTFRNLAKGVEVNGGTFRVRDAAFYNCAVGVHATSTTGAVMFRNKFYLGNMHIDYKVEDNRQIGVAFEGMTNGITFEENTFYSYFGNTTNTTYGTTARALLPFDGNVVKNNHYYNMAYGNWAEENNGNIYEGLHYLCNSNDNPTVTGWNYTAIDPTNTGMALRKEQGLLGPFAEYAPARNTFSHVLGGNGGVDDLRDFLSDTPDGYNYYYDPMVSSEVPLYENINEISSFDQSNTCPSPYYLKERRSYRSLTKPERVANENNYLAHFSAYQKVKDSFDNLDKNTSMSAKDQVRKQVSFHLQEMEKSAYKGYMTVARDSAASKEDLRLWMRRFNNQTGDYLLVEDYIANREYESAKKALGMMYQKYTMGVAELSDFEKVESIYDELIASEGERLSKEIIKDLVTIADSKEGQACYLARRILSADYGYFFRPILTELPGMELDGKGAQDADNQEPKIRMLVSPNPTDYDVVFDWSKFETIGCQVRIEITTATGGLIEVLTPASGETNRPWTTKSVSGNICYYRLLIDDKEVDGGQIIINK